MTVKEPEEGTWGALLADGRDSYPKFKPTTLDAAQPITWSSLKAGMDRILVHLGGCPRCSDALGCDDHPDTTVPAKYR